MSVRRFGLSVLVVSVLGLAACEGRGPSPDATPGSPVPPRHVPRAAPPAVAAGSAAPAGAEAWLGVRNADGAPVVGREVRILDARGALARGLTDEEGGLVFDGVVTPYDLAVEGSPSEPGGGTETILVGLTSAHADVVVDERDATPPPPAQAFTVALALGPRANGEAVHVWVASASPHGAGLSEVSVGEAEGSSVVVEHIHRTRWGLGRDRVRIHVLARRDGDATFRHVSVDAGDSAPGAVHDLGVIDLGGVGVAGTALAVSRTGEGPTGGPSSTAVSLRLDDGTSFELERVEADASSFVVPDLPGAQVCVAAWGEGAVAGGDDLHAGARAERCLATGGGALATRSVELELADPVGLAHPETGGVVSRRGPGLRLAAGGHPRVARVALVDERRGTVRARVVTSADEVSFEKLARLGVPRLDPGPHVVDVEALLGTTLDAETSRLRAPLDERRRTSRRVRVTVTP